MIEATAQEYQTIMLFSIQHARLSNVITIFIIRPRKVAQTDNDRRFNYFFLQSSFIKRYLRLASLQEYRLIVPESPILLSCGKRNRH